MIIDRFPLLDAIHTPQENAHTVEQGDDGNNGEGDGGRHADAVAEIEERGGDGAEDDGEFELKGHGQ
jgi:hypothetical protein